MARFLSSGFLRSIVRVPRFLWRENNFFLTGRMRTVCAMPLAARAGLERGENDKAERVVGEADHRLEFGLEMRSRPSSRLSSSPAWSPARNQARDRARIAHNGPARDTEICVSRRHRFPFAFATLFYYYALKNALFSHPASIAARCRREPHKEREEANAK